MAAFDANENLILYHGVALLGFKTDDTAGNPTAKHAVALGDFGDTTEGEDGFLEVGFFGLNRLDAEVFHACFVEDDGVRIDGGVDVCDGK